jgi:zinc transport system substrate-binding protein
MKNHWIRFLIGLGIIVVLTIILFLLWDGNSVFKAENENDSLIFAATIFPLADIARNIGGEEVTVIQLVPSGASPHSFALSPQQLTKLGQAKAIFMIGHGLDDPLVAVIKKSFDVPSITVDQNIILRSFDPDDHQESVEPNIQEREEIDPHYWLSIPNAKTIAGTIAQIMQEYDQANATRYASNLAIFTEQLNSAEATMQRQAAMASQPNFIAMHNAWGYFAAQYGFNLVATYEPIEGKQPSLRDLAKLQNIADQYGITTFYAEPQKKSGSAVILLEEDFGLKTKVLDPLGGAQSDDNYIKLMQRNLNALVGN